jgi:hypothetical protein
MAKATPITERFQHFVEDLQESFGAICKPGRNMRRTGFSTI